MKAGSYHLFVFTALIVSINGIPLRILEESSFLLGDTPLQSGSSLVNGDYRLNLQSDGNLLLKDKLGYLIWASGSNKPDYVKPFRLVMQNDGNLVIYDSTPPNGLVAWSSGSLSPNGKSPFKLTLGQDANIFVSDSTGSVFWSINKVIAHANPSPGCVLLYADCEYKGDKREICSDSPTLDNIQFSSVVLSDGVKIRMYSEQNYGGNFNDLEVNSVCLEVINFNDKLKSLKFSSKNCLSNEFFENGSCKTCPNKCTACKSSSECTSCVDGVTLNSNKICGLQCPDGQYDNNGKCEACFSECYTCSSFRKCLTCPNGYNLNSNDNSCTLSCASNQYSNGTQCLSCPSMCATCTSSTLCKSCLPNANLTPQYSCQAICLENQYLDANDGSCKPCNSKCNQCYDSNTCKSCSGNLTLLNGNCVSDCISTDGQKYAKYNNVCYLVSTCPVGNYQNYENKGNCEPCDNHCIQCVNKNSCSQCDQKYSLLGLEKTTNKYYEVTAGVNTDLTSLSFELKSTVGESSKTTYQIGSSKCVSGEELAQLLSTESLAFSLIIMLIFNLLL